MTEKPIHVRVAEALGCKPVPYQNLQDETDVLYWICDCKRRPHGKSGPCRDPNQIPDFQEDWEAIGLLIEKYGITLVKVVWVGPPSNARRLDVPYWEALYASYDGWDGLESDAHADGATPLLAVCHLILALAEAGKLEAA